MRSSGYIASLVAAGAMAVHQNGKLQNDNKHYEIPNYGLSTDQQEAVNLHNDARKAVGNGPLSWDDSLAAGAQQWANHLAFIGFLQHSKGNHGENLYMGATDSPYSVSAKNFLAENSQYNGEAISASNYLHFGHYTQCVWKHTNKIGMAVSKDSHGVSWVVARYQKPGVDEQHAR
ncbi:hypothetical protein FOMA001_g17417 [Fusarium oxysporum f. sp. matthiolae]|nr:hypothetical protein FOMA001_g18757 [Fusarium oxysporum f. sp. matthiolae]KAH7464490.1 hypothetical protein FOMA001_g17417 [Fusarium oxysporum f. sp. matthiolae]